MIPPRAESRPIVLQTRPMRWADVVKVGLCAVALAAVAFTLGYLWPSPGRVTIIEAVDEVLPAGVVQLYPREPAKVVRFIDGVGAWREARMSQAGYEALREVGE